MDLKEKQIIYVDNKPHIKCGVVLLSSKNGNSKIGLNSNAMFNKPYLYYFNEGAVYNECQHLYITSNKEIKEGDLFYNTFDNKIQKCTKHQLHDGEFAKLRVYVEDGDYNESICKKIIATTDTSLVLLNEQYFDVNKKRKSAILEQKNLPQPSQQFIEKYIEEYNKGNIIIEILVEVELINKKEYVDDQDAYGYDNRITKLKLDSQNQVTIKKQKNSWSRKELHSIIEEFEYDKGVIDYKKLIPVLLKAIDYDLSENWLDDKWIEENL